jgi:molybdenum cofactor biosynthesis enzyme
MKPLLALLLLAQTAFAGGLKWERTTKRIEARPEDRVVKTEFTYRNTGNTPVRIESVRGVCVCCTAAYATKKKLAPGEGGSVVVRVDFEKKPLPLVKPVTVKTDDGETVVLIVEVYPK